MNPILHFLLILLIATVSGYVGGNYIINYTDNKNNKKSYNKLIIGILIIITGSIVGTSAFIFLKKSETTAIEQKE